MQRRGGRAAATIRAVLSLRDVPWRDTLDKTIEALSGGPYVRVA